VKEGKLLIITAPSGAGKTTIVHDLLRHFPVLAFSVSVTTRPQRPHEMEGVDYYFTSESSFREKIEDGQFAEWQEVYPGRLYGTLRSEMTRLWAMDKCVVFDIDVLGAMNLKKLYPQDSLSIFIAPPSLEVLENRLLGRGTETESTIRMRLDRARMEMEQQENFDLIVVNDDLETACQTVRRAVEQFLL
jgi:guanylate kinase